MAEYFAQIDENGKVIDHSVVADEIVANGGEQAGAELLSELFGGTWVRFSRDAEFRVHRAHRGFTYDETLDAFIPPKPFESWVLENYVWVAPIPMPEDGAEYRWDEEAGDWVEVV